MILPVNSEGVETGIPDTGFDAILASLGHTVVEPHSDERLGRVDVSRLVSDASVAIHSYCETKFSSRERNRLYEPLLLQIPMTKINFTPIG